jgi:hypothetical protein
VVRFVKRSGRAGTRYSFFPLTDASRLHQRGFLPILDICLGYMFGACLHAHA